MTSAVVCYDKWYEMDPLGGTAKKRAIVGSFFDLQTCGYLLNASGECLSSAKYLWKLVSNRLWGGRYGPGRLEMVIVML